MFPRCFPPPAVNQGKTAQAAVVLMVFIIGVSMAAEPCAAAPPAVRSAPAASPVVTVTPVPGPTTLRVVLSDVTLVDIKGEIRTVVIANPEVLDASVSSQHRILLLGKKPGTTTILVADAGGGLLLKTSVMVVPSENGMVTLDRGVKESTLSCAPRCVVVDAGKDSASASGGPPAPPGAPAAPSSPSVPPVPPSSSPASPMAGGGPPLPPPNVQVNQ